MPDAIADHVAAPSALYAFVIALLVVALVTTPLSMRLARRLGVMAVPGGRHIHDRPVPLLGGLAIVAGIVVALAPNIPWSDQNRAIVLGTVLIALLGAVDDAIGITPVIKLAGQVACALVPISQSVTIDHLTVPVILNRGIDLGVMQYPVTLLFVVAVANIINLADGMDGLAAGVCAISAATFAVLAISLDRTAAAAMAAAVAGACIGFLRFNFHPARTFMGDSGSLALGFLLATTSIAGVMKTTAVLSLVFPLVVLLVPILDTGFVIAKRLKYGRPIASADRNHFHHRMLRIGYSQRRAALLLYTWCGVLAAFAIAARFLHYRTGGYWHLWPTLVLTAFALVALLTSAYVVYSLEILKYRHLRKLGLARRADAPDDQPIVTERRRRRRATVGD